MGAPVGDPAVSCCALNDVVLTRNAAYFTASEQPVIYAAKRDPSAVTPIALTGFPMTPETDYWVTRVSKR